MADVVLNIQMMMEVLDSVTLLHGGLAVILGLPGVVTQHNTAIVVMVTA